MSRYFWQTTCVQNFRTFTINAVLFSCFQGLSALHLSAIHGRLSCLKLLIEKYKFDINLPSSTGWRAIHLCISNQTGKRAMQCLEYLLEKKADASW